MNTEEKKKEKEGKSQRKEEDHERKRREREYLESNVQETGFHTQGFIAAVGFTVLSLHISSKFLLATVYSCFTAAYLWILKGLTHNGRGNQRSPSQGKRIVLVCYLWHNLGMRKGPMFLREEVGGLLKLHLSTTAFDFPLKMPVYLTIS